MLVLAVAHADNFYSCLFSHLVSLLQGCTKRVSAHATELHHFNICSPACAFCSAVAHAQVGDGASLRPCTCKGLWRCVQGRHRKPLCGQRRVCDGTGETCRGRSRCVCMCLHMCLRVRLAHSCKYMCMCVHLPDQAMPVTHCMLFSPMNPIALSPCSPLLPAVASCPQIVYLTWCSNHMLHQIFMCKGVSVWACAGAVLPERHTGLAGPGAPGPHHPSVLPAPGSLRTAPLSAAAPPIEK